MGRAVLVAISIPIFTSQLEKSREAVDLANIRSAYAEVTTSALTGEAVNDVTKNADGSYSKTVTLTQAVADWQTDVSDVKIGTAALNGTKPTAKGSCTVTYKPDDDATKDGSVTVTFG
ncbi:hypothetical protein [Blautia sp.]